MKQSVYNAVKLTGVVAARAYMGILVGLILLSVAPLLVQWEPTLVTSGSMEPNVMTGDIIAAEHISQDNLKAGGVTIGNVVLAQNPAQPGHLYTHRITQILPDNAGYITKGDANLMEDATPLPMKNVVGIERLRVPYAGMPIQKLRNGDIAPVVIFGVLTIIAQIIIMKDNKAAKLASGPTDDSRPNDGQYTKPLRRKSGRRRAPTQSVMKPSVLVPLLLALVFPVAGSAAAFFGSTAPSQSGFAASAVFPMPATSLASLRFGLAEPGGLDDVDAEARNVNEYPSMIQTYTDFTKPFDMNTTNAIIAKGSLPVITWEPFDASIGGTNQPNYKLSNITGGTYDTYITSVANQLVAAGNPTVAIRFAHEMNGNWYPWSEQVNGNAPGDYVKAWKHVVDIFNAKGLTRVQWMWAPNVPYSGSTDVAGLYPGTAYVTMTGLDGFNFGTTNQYSTWTRPWDLFGSGLGALQYVAPDKNIIVTETASVETEGANTKEQWIADMVYYLNHWGDGKGGIRVAGFIWFDQIKYDQLSLGQTKATNWRIDKTTTSSKAMRDALAAR